MKRNDIISEILDEKTDNIFNHYNKIISKIEKADKTLIKNNLISGITELKYVDINKIILAGAVLKYAGYPYSKLFSFFANYLNNRINLTQFNFVVKAIFEDNPPLTSDVIFDIAEYTYLDDKVLERRVHELSEKLKTILNFKLLLFLLVLFFRNDLRNENYRLIFEILLRIGENRIGELEKNRVVKKFLAESKFKKPSGSEKLSVEKSISKIKESSKEKEVKEEYLRQEAAVEVEAGIDEKTETEIKEEDQQSRASIFRRLKFQLIIGGTIIVLIALIFLLINFLSHKGVQITQKQVPIGGTNQNILEERKIPEKNHKYQIEPIKSSKNPDVMKKQIEGAEIVNEYIIRKGDTLSEIAKKYYGRGYYYKHLADINRIKNPDLIYPGTKIRIPINISKTGKDKSTDSD